jgi:hypothetical protein
MAFVTIASSAIATGEPVTNTLLTQIKDNEDDLNSRLSTVEGSNNIFAPLFFTIVGNGQVKDGLMFWRVPFDITLLGARTQIMEVNGSVSGTFSIDIEKKTGAGAFGTILSSVISTSSGTLYTLNSGTLSTTALTAGDIVRINQDSVMTGMTYAHVILEFEAA